MVIYENEPAFSRASLSLVDAKDGLIKGGLCYVRGAAALFYRTSFQLVTGEVACEPYLYAYSG